MVKIVSTSEADADADPYEAGSMCEGEWEMNDSTFVTSLATLVEED